MIKKRFYLILLSGSCCLNLVSAQTGNVNRDEIYKEQMKGLYAAIHEHFFDSSSGYYKLNLLAETGKNPYTYLWSMCALFQAANEMEKVEPGENRLRPILAIIRDYYDPAPPEPGFADYITKPGFKGGERYYDDNQWIGITANDAFVRLKDSTYLELGMLIYKFMMTGYDTVLSGGLYWKENRKTSKNTCSNGPGIIVALQLYQATREKKYLDTALHLYQWTNLKLQAPSGLYFDNIDVRDKRISRATLSYNTGTMLQANIYLFECTGQKKYLSEAIAIADSSLSFFYGSGTFRDSYWFNVVLLRAYQHLLRYDPDPKYVLGFKRCLDKTIQTEKNDQNLFLDKGKPVDLVSQAGMLEILARFAWLEKQGMLHGTAHTKNR